MLDLLHFHAIANATLMHLHDQLEQAYDTEDLEDLDLNEGAGILSITCPDGTVFVVTKHEPSRQLWLASAVSGGLHFGYCQQAQDWCLPDGKTLKQVLAGDLMQRAKLSVTF